MTAPGYSLKTFQQVMPGGEPGGTWRSPLVEETVLEAQKSQDDQSSEGRIPKRRDLQMEETSEICREYPPSLQLSIDQHSRMRKLPRSGEGTIQYEQREQSPELTQGWEQFLSPLARVENHKIHRALGRERREFYPRLNATLVPPHKA